MAHPWEQTQPWEQATFLQEYPFMQEDFITVPDSYPDAAPQHGGTKLIDGSGTPPQQVPEPTLDINMSFLGDQAPQELTQGSPGYWLNSSKEYQVMDISFPSLRDQAPQGLPQGSPEYWSHPQQETQVMLHLPQQQQQQQQSQQGSPPPSLSPEVPEYPPSPRLSPEVPEGPPLQMVPQRSSTAAVGVGSPPSPAAPSKVSGGGKTRRAHKPQRTKMYQLTEKFLDPKMEKRRLDAINSKRNRDLKKATMEELRRKVDEYTAERDKLQQDVEDLKLKEAQLLEQLHEQPAAPTMTTVSHLHHSLTPNPPAAAFATPLSSLSPFTPSLTPPLPSAAAAATAASVASPLPSMLPLPHSHSLTSPTAALPPFHHLSIPLHQLSLAPSPPPPQPPQPQ